MSPRVRKDFVQCWRVLFCRLKVNKSVFKMITIQYLISCQFPLSLVTVRFLFFSIVKSMNDYVLDTNQQQLQARKEIADYIKMLEQQLHDAKNSRLVSINERDGNYQYYPEGMKQYGTDVRDDCEAPTRQVAEQNQTESLDFAHYLKSSQSDFDEDGFSKDMSDHDPFDITDNEEEDFNLESCFRSSTRHLVQPDNVRMARITTIEGFVSPYPTPGRDDSDDAHVPKRPPRKTHSGKRRKLPEVSRRLSIESGRTADSTVTRSDETASITSFESQISRDTADLRRGPRSGSNRQLPSVPSGEEINLSQASVVKKEPVTELPNVVSIYKVKGPQGLNNQQQDSGLGESVKNSPDSPDHGHKFSLTSLRRKFSKGKTTSGKIFQTYDINVIPGQNRSYE